MTTATAGEVLSKQQRRRVAALRAARDVLTTVSVMTKSGAEAGPLIRVARYITTGEDPADPAPTDHDC